MSDNTVPLPSKAQVSLAHGAPPPPSIAPLQKLGNAVNMFGMAVANEDHKVMTATKKHLLDIVNAIHPDHEKPSLIQTSESK